MAEGSGLQRVNSRLNCDPENERYSAHDGACDGGNWKFDGELANEVSELVRLGCDDEGMLLPSQILPENYREDNWVERVAISLGEGISVSIATRCKYAHDILREINKRDTVSLFCLDFEVEGVVCDREAMDFDE